MDFEARKQAVLQALAADQRDKSRKGGVDAPIANLIERINNHPCFFTTSSCSGRVSLFLDPLEEAAAQKRKKKGGEWIYVSHETADAQQVVTSVREKYLNRGLQGLLVFKYEPFILALECSSAGAGQQLVACAIASGFRESGITNLGKRVIVAVRCSIRLEAPIAKAGQLLVSEEYLRVLTTIANEKMEMNCNRTDKFLTMFIDQVEDSLMDPEVTILAGGVCINRRENEDGKAACPGSETEESCLDGTEEVDVESAPSCEAENRFQRMLFSGTRNGTVVSGKELEPRQRSLLQLENRQIRLMSRMHNLEAKLATLGFIPRAERSRVPRGVICRNVVEASPNQFQWTGSKCDAAHPNGRKTSEVGHGRSKGTLRISGNDVFTSAELAATGLAISHGCSVLAAPLTVSGEPVERLHRWSHSACAIPRSRKSTGDSVIIFGGFGGLGTHTRLKDVLFLYPDTGSLLAVGSQYGGPSARQAHACVLIDDKMVVIGGREGPRRPLGDVWVFSITGKIWTSIAASGALLPPRHRHAAVAIGSHIYVFGGMSESEIFNDLHVLDTDSMHWARLTCQGELPYPRHSHSLASFGERIYLFGGRDEKNIYGDMYVLEVGLLQWTRIETTGRSPVPRFSHSMTLWGNFLVVFGGCPITKTSKEIFLLHLELLTWRPVTLCLPFDSLPVRHSVCAVKNKLFVIGGGAACFAFGSAFNSPLVLDMENILVAERSENVGSSEGPYETTADCPEAKQGVDTLPSQGLSKLKGTPIKDGLPARAAFGESVVYVLEKSVAKQGKDILKKLGWLDSTRKAKILREGKNIAFPVTAAAVALFASYQETQGLVQNRTNFSSGDQHMENMLSILCLLKGSMSKASLQANGRRLNTVQRSLQQEMDTFLDQRKLSPSLLSELPRRWERLGDMAVLPASSFRDPIWDTLGSDLWITLARALGVSRLARQAAIAANCTRDSRLELLLGTTGWVEHRENGIMYCFDATKCMFSSGNVSEKLRMATMQCFGDIVVDLFAGIGYYVLPFLLKAGAKHVYACEWNPNALVALRHNLRVNLVEDRCTIIEGDNRVMAPERVANRVCLGLLPTSEGSWDAAVRALRREGGSLHVHGNVKDTEQEQWVAYMLQSFNNIACSQGLEWKIAVSNVERVKWYAPHVRHIVVDVTCTSVCHVMH